MYNRHNSNGNCNGNTYNANCNNNSTYNANSNGNCNGSTYNANSNNNTYNANRSRSCNENSRSSCPVEFHLHEVQGSVVTTDAGCGCHNHRFATVSCEPITLRNGDHAHQVSFRTDTYEGHYHEFSGCTTDAFEICEGHVHYLEGKTSEQADHCHSFKVITHIEDPTEE